MRVGRVGLGCFGAALGKGCVAEVPEFVVREVRWGCKVGVGGEAGSDVAVAVGVGVGFLG